MSIYTSEEFYAEMWFDAHEDYYFEPEMEDDYPVSEYRDDEDGYLDDEEGWITPWEGAEDSALVIFFEPPF
jgi:hypothetical protein